jgi:hypothetical protein
VPTPAPAPAPSGWWKSSFENGAATPSEWSFWGQGQENLYGAWGPGQPNQIVTAASVGVPARDGAYIAKLYHAKGDPAIHHKLYKGFRDNWPLGSEPLGNASVSPADVSARYMVDLYIPSAGLDLSNSGSTSLVQFKEDYLNQNGAFHSVPSFWMGLHASPGYPVFSATAWNQSRFSTAPIDARPFLNRWVTVELRLYQHNRLEFYFDGELKWTAYDSQFRVGRKWNIGQPGDSYEDPGGIVTANRGWTFGIGNYVMTTGTQTMVYADNARILPLP